MLTDIPKKILVVDDEEDILTHLSNVLRRANYEVFTTTSGKEAVALAKEVKPHLIILDIIMPDMDGGEVSSLLSKDPLTFQIPIVFLTGIITKDEESRIKKLYKHTVIAKSSTVRELLEAVSKAFLS